MKRRSDICKSHEMIPEIPFDLVIEILMRVPAKSLMRFKSVSKLWSSLICSRKFTTRYPRVSSSPHRLYMTLNFLDNSHNKSKLLSFSSPPSSDITTMSSFVIDQVLTIPAMEGYYASHVFHGLMCFVKGSSAQIYNTSTRQLVVLPDIEESNIIAEDHNLLKIMYRIGHDPVCDQYKVVCIVARLSDKVEKFRTYLSEHWVFLLGGDKSSRWRKIPCQSPHKPLTTQVLNINGRMHYLAWVRRFSTMLVSFDFSSEEISMLQASDQDIWFFNTCPIEYCGKMALLDHSNLETEGMMELWVMEDGEKNTWWSKKNLVLHLSQVNIVNNISLRAEGTTRNGEVIFVPRNTTLVYIFLYDLQKNLMRKVEIKETPYHTKFLDVVGLDDVENLLYL